MLCTHSAGPSICRSRRQDTRRPLDQPEAWNHWWLWYWSPGQQLDPRQQTTSVNWKSTTETISWWWQKNMFIVQMFRMLKCITATRDIDRQDASKVYRSGSDQDPAKSEYWIDMAHRHFLVCPKSIALPLLSQDNYKK